MGLTTYSTQTHLFPASGTEITSTGDGLHVYLVRDVAEGCNNLYRADPGVTFAMPESVVGGYGSVATREVYRRTWGAIGTGGLMGEYHIDSIPVFVTAPPSKMRYTLGVRATVSGGTSPTVVISAVKVTFAQTPYPGKSGVTAGVVDAFNSLYLGSLCVSATWTGTGSPAADTGHMLADATTAGTIDPVYCTSADGSTSYAWAVISATVSSTGNPTGCLFYLTGFTCWSLPE